MRDDDATHPLPVVVQPNPMLDTQPVGWFRVALTTLGAATVVVLVLYGLSRPPEPQQMAAAPEAAPAAPGATTGQGGQQQPAAPQQGAAAQKGAAAPATTGQGQPENQSVQGQGKSPRADSATGGNASAPSDKAAPPAK